MKKICLFVVLSILSLSSANAKPDRIKELEGQCRHHTTLDWKEVLALCDELIKYMPEHTNAHFERGCALAQLGRDEEAIESYRLALRYDYASKGKYILGEVYYKIGISFGALGKLEEALYFYNRGIKFGVTHRHIYHDKAEVQVKLGLDLDL